MFERFTDQARRVVVAAESEARFLGHDHVDTGHLLIGIIHMTDGRTATALQAAGISLDVVHAMVRESRHRGRQREKYVTFETETRQAIEQSLEEAFELGNNFIGAEHILLAIIRREDTSAARILKELGVDLDRLREETAGDVEGQTMAAPPAQQTPSRPEELIGRAAGLLRRQGNPDAVDFLKIVAHAELWNINTTGDHGEHIPGTQGIALFVPPEQAEDWHSVEDQIETAIFEVSRHVDGKLVTEVNALPLVDDYDPDWRNLP